MPVVRVEMTDKDIVERAGALLERAVVPVRARRPYYKTPYRTTIKGAPALALMHAILPQVGSLRRRQIERAIASWHGHRARWRRPAATCSATQCPRPGSRRGLCERHYDRWWKAKRRGQATNFGPSDPPLQVFGTAPDGTLSEDCAVAWLAGLLEGEGTFAINRYSPEIAYPVISLKMCDPGVVARAARLLDAPSVQRREPRQEGWSPTYVAAISGQAAAIWMRRLRSLMGTRRRAAIDAALAAYHPIRLVDAPESCVVPDCDQPHRGRGLCHKHYMMWSRDKAKGREARIDPLR
jgi:hypothetical protein